MKPKPDFDALMAQFQPMVARICASYERDRDLARELAQEAWFAIWRALPNYRGEAAPKTFVARIAQFRAISHVARRSRLPPGVALSEDLASPLLHPEAEALADGERNGGRAGHLWPVRRGGGGLPPERARPAEAVQRASPGNRLRLSY